MERKKKLSGIQVLETLFSLPDCESDSEEDGDTDEDDESEIVKDDTVPQVHDPTSSVMPQNLSTISELDIDDIELVSSPNLLNNLQESDESEDENVNVATFWKK